MNESILVISLGVAFLDLIADGLLDE